MSWIYESKQSWLERLAIRVIRSGKTPRHVAFIMDGNRRYANKNNMETIQGHKHGFNKLTELLHWCNSLNIKEITVYAFSTENFKRAKEEVEGLMTYIREKLERMLKEIGRLKEQGMCVRMLGELSLLPEDIQKQMAEVMLETKNNNGFCLNICLAYTSREEICSAVRHLAEGVESGLILPKDVSEELFEQCLYGGDVSTPDILIRTSGEVRLSDFLLWQTSYSVLSFLPVLWPEFSVWNLLFAVLMYQCYYKEVEEIKERHNAERLQDKGILTTEDPETKLKVKNATQSNKTKVPISEKPKYKKEQKRLEVFQSFVQTKRNSALEQMRCKML